MIRIATSPKTDPAINNFPENSQQLFPIRQRSIAVVPSNQQVKAFMDNVIAYDQSNHMNYTMFPNRTAMDEFYLKYNKLKIMGIIFDDPTLATLNYSIRVDYSSISHRGLYVSAGS